MSGQSGSACETCIDVVDDNGGALAKSELLPGSPGTRLCLQILPKGPDLHRIVVQVSFGKSRCDWNFGRDWDSGFNCTCSWD